MANEQNLVKFTSSQNRDEAKKNGAKGGKKSGAARRKKADLRKAIQSALDSEYTDKNGKKFTGTEGIAQVLVQKALTSKDKDCVAAIKYLCEVMGINRTEEQKKKDKAELELLQARIKATNSDHVTHETEMPELYKALGAVSDDDIL